MKKWRVCYFIRNKNLYTFKDLYAESAEKAIKKARVKYIEDLYIINEEGVKIG